MVQIGKKVRDDIIRMADDRLTKIVCNPRLAGKRGTHGQGHFHWIGCDTNEVLMETEAKNLPVP